MGQQILGYSNLTVGTSLIGIIGFNRDIVLNIMYYWSSLPSIGGLYEEAFAHFYDSSNKHILTIYVGFCRQGTTIVNGDCIDIECFDYTNRSIGDFHFKRVSGNNEITYNETNFLISGTINSIVLEDGDFPGSAQEIFNSSFNLLKITNYTGLYGLLQKTYFKLNKLSKKLDYYLDVATTRFGPTYTVASNYSGVTVSSSAIYMYANALYINARLTLTSTAQTNLGTGNITNTTLCTFTFSNIMNQGDPSNDDSENLMKISHISSNGAIMSGYSNGNACPASFHYIATVSGSNLTIAISLDALYAQTSEFRPLGFVPIARVASCYD